MNLTKSELITAMQKCLPGVEKGSSLIEGADAFLFGNNQIHTYNDSIAVSVPVNLDGMAGAVKAMDFFKLVSKINAAIIMVEPTDDGKLHLIAGRTKASITLLKTQTEAYIQELNVTGLKWIKIPDNFLEGLKLCKMSCNPTPLRGICVVGNHMYSTDSVRINMFTLSSEMESFWLDDPTVGDLMKMGPITDYCIVGNWAHLRMGDGTVFSCRRKDHSQFPVSQILTQISMVEAIDPGLKVSNHLPQALVEVVDRVATMASGDGAASQLVKLTFKKDEVNIFATKSSGSAEESAPLETPFEVEPCLILWVESNFLTEAAKKVMDFDVVRAGGSCPALVFHSPNYIQLASTNDGI